MFEWLQLLARVWQVFIWDKTSVTGKQLQGQVLLPHSNFNLFAPLWYGNNPHVIKDCACIDILSLLYLYIMMAIYMRIPRRFKEIKYRIGLFLLSHAIYSSKHWPWTPIYKHPKVYLWNYFKLFEHMQCLPFAFPGPKFKSSMLKFKPDVDA